MRRLAAVLGAAFALTLVVPAWADENPTYNGPTSASEAAFVKAIQADLNQRFATAADAEKGLATSATRARIDTGAIQLRKHELAVERSAAPEPAVVRRQRQPVGRRLLDAAQARRRAPGPVGRQSGTVRTNWTWAHPSTGHGDPTTGALTYDLWMPNPKFVAGGGNPAQPDAAALVKMGKVKDPSTVATIFEFPALWDLIVWVKPNPKGAFAEKDPLVTPSANASK